MTTAQHEDGRAFRLRRELGAENLQRLDDRRRREQERRLGHQGLGDRSSQMTLTSRLIGERVEDRERRGSEPQGEPHERRGFLVGESEALVQELGDFLLLPGFGFETSEECKLHMTSPWIRRLRHWV